MILKLATILILPACSVIKIKCVPVDLNQFPVQKTATTTVMFTPDQMRRTPVDVKVTIGEMKSDLLGQIDEVYSGIKAFNKECR